MGKTQLAVSEAFYSLQGEGKTVGIPSVFLRLKSCNLTCGFTQKQANSYVKGEIDIMKKDLPDSTWFCDTVNVFLTGHKKDFEDVLPIDFVHRLRQGAHLIVTGGEPLLQREGIVNYLTWFINKYQFTPFVELETNGTIPLENLGEYIDQVNCSPKLSNSGVKLEARYCPNVIEKLNERRDTIFKFVISSSQDWQEVVEDYLPYIDKKKIWLMPAASTLKELLINNKVTAQMAIDNCVNFTSRIQVEVWDKTTGV